MATTYRQVTFVHLPPTLKHVTPEGIEYASGALPEYIADTIKQGMRWPDDDNGDVFVLVGPVVQVTPAGEDAGGDPTAP